MVELLTAILAGVLGVGLVALISIPFMILRGWVLSWLWLWFLVPLGLPEISVVHGIGISGVVAFLTAKYSKTNKDESAEAYAFMIMVPFLALGIGYLVHLFM